MPTLTAAPESPAEVISTPRRRLDEALARLREGGRTFARLSLKDRIVLAGRMQAGYLDIAEVSVLAACEAKGIQPGTPPEGEEWANPCSVVRQLRLIRESLSTLERTGNTPVGKLSRTIGGKLAIRMFPGSAVDGALFSGVTVDVHMLDGIDAEAMAARRAGFYKGRGHDGRTALILGAGNLAAIPAMDVITKLFNEGTVCLLKMNPINAYVGPFIEKAFAAAIERGFLAVAYGGADEGAYLAHHPEVDEIHLTGSDRTYDSIVWGPAGPDRDLRKARNAPLVDKPVTAELGNISPVLVVPGPYSDRELAEQAEAIAGGMVFNASFNCNAAKMLLTPGGWSRRAHLLGALGRVLAATPTRRAYYPGAEDRWRQLTARRAGVETIGAAPAGHLPWTIMPGLDAADISEPAFSTEPFCSVLSQVEVGTDDPIEFLGRAVAFANDRLWGTLSATFIVHPKTLRDPAVGPEVERAIVRLRYGAVAVNAWTGLLFSLASPPWGAYPGSLPADIQSGTGWVHNTSMLEGVEKAVMRHPLTAVPKPATFPSHRTAHTLMRRITSLEARGSWRNVPGVVAAAMWG